MQIAIHLPLPLVRKTVETTRGVLPFREQRLKVGATFIVELVQRLERMTINQKGREAWLVCCYHHQIIDAEIHARDPLRIYISRLYVVLINNLHVVMGGMWHDAHLSDGVKRPLGGDANQKARRNDPASVLGMTADGLDSVCEQIASLFVTILWQLGMALKFFGIDFPFSAGGKVTRPGEADLFQHPLRHLGRKCAILRSGLEQPIQLTIAENSMVGNVSLACEVESGVVEVLAGKRQGTGQHWDSRKPPPAGGGSLTLSVRWLMRVSA